MPELPDVELYLSCVPRAHRRVSVLERVRLATPFLLRSVEPPLDQARRAGRDRLSAHRQAHRVGARGGRSSSCFT